MSERTCQHDSRPHTPEDIERAGGPGFLTPGFLLATPSHPSRTVASVPRSLPVTVAGAAPDLHRLPSTHQRGAELPHAASSRQSKTFNAETQRRGASGIESSGASLPTLSASLCLCV